MRTFEGWLRWGVAKNNHCCAGALNYTGCLDDSHIPGNQSQKFPKDEKIASILGTINEKTQDRFQSIVFVYPMTEDNPTKFQKEFE